MFDLSNTVRLFSKVIEIFHKSNSKTIKLLNQNMEEKPYNFRLGNGFLDLKNKAPTI